MSLPGSGPLSLSQIAGEFPNFLNTSNVVVSGSSAPHRMSDFYAAIPSVPSSGAIAISNFRGKSGTFTYTIDENIDRVNLRTYLLNRGWDGTVLVYLTLAAGRYLWSDDTSTPAVTTGSFPRGLIFTNNGFIMGKGGKGGDADSRSASARNGQNGGTAISVSATCRIVNNGYIGGGGGGGGAGPQRQESDGNIIGSGGGGGAGGGAGGIGYSIRNNIIESFATKPGGAGGAIGNVGGQGIGGESVANSNGGGAGGAGGAFRQQNFETDDNAGGGGGGRIFPGIGGVGSGTGGSGGSAGNAGTAASAGGGGGWGAPGGNGSNGVGGGGGAAILKNGNFVFVQGTTSNIYGSIVS